jgi:hypothetical protein
MSSSTNTVCKSRRLSDRLTLLLAGVACLAAACYAQDADLRAPADAVAGSAASIATTGGGTGTFYLIGPSIALKRDVRLGEPISLAAKELQSAGKYVAIICSASCHSVGFFVAPSKPVNLTFLVHPSRAPVGQNDVVSGVAMPFDEFHNLVLAPATVDFQLTTAASAPASHRVATQGGVAWFHTSSGRSAGAVQVTASIVVGSNTSASNPSASDPASSNDVSARRVVQQVASDPCSLRIKGERNAKGISVETEPVRDCTGNPVPDGTIVTFTAKDAQGTDTVDAPIKKGVARAQMTGTGPVAISAASGVVMGNELRLGGQ